MGLNFGPSGVKTETVVDIFLNYVFPGERSFIITLARRFGVLLVLVRKLKAKLVPGVFSER